MNLESYLAEAAGQGVFDSAGRFGVGLPQLLDKLAQFQFPDPTHAPLAVVTAAVHNGARHIEVTARGPKVHYGLAMPEPDLNDPQNSLLWALAANRATALRIQLNCPEQGRQLLLTTLGHQLVTSPKQAGLTLDIQRQKNAPDETVPLTRHCPLCPVPLRINGQLLQVPLAQAYRGRPAAWSAGVPEALRPSGPAQLETPLSVFLTRSAAPAPVWVAVVGAVAYPFVLPGAGNVSGVLWTQDLRTDLGLTTVIRDKSWRTLREQLRNLAKNLNNFEQILSAP